MKTTRPKQTLMFPNSWALNSFLLRLKRNADWEYVASSDDRHIKAKPKGAREYILIGLSKAGRETGLVYVEINAEALGDGTEGIWNTISETANLYRC